MRTEKVRQKFEKQLRFFYAGKAGCFLRQKFTTSRIDDTTSAEHDVISIISRLDVCVCSVFIDRITGKARITPISYCPRCFFFLLFSSDHVLQFFLVRQH